eukprot:4025880-Amphidinium_carterae.1
MKSRLVARGDLSTISGRTDSPTADKECIFIVLSFAASRRLTTCSADLDHGYFQGEKLSKLRVLRPPKSGIPDGDITTAVYLQWSSSMVPKMPDEAYGDVSVE